MIRHSVIAIVVLLTASALAADERVGEGRVDASLRLALHGYSYDIGLERYDGLAEKLQDVPPFGILRIAYRIGGVSLVLRADAIAKYDRGGRTNLLPSESGYPVVAEFNFLREGYLQAEADRFLITFGRQPVHLGPAPVTSFHVTGRVPFLDALQFRGHLGPLTLIAVWATLENRRTIEEARAEELLGPLDRQLYGWGRNTVLLSIHRFQWEFGRLTAGIGGQTLIAREMNQFHLADLFPVFVRHNANIAPNNLSLVGDLALRISDGLDAYVLFGFDEIAAGAFGFDTDDGLPTIDAYAAGARVRTRLGGRQVFVAAEVGLTHQLWGSFDDNQRLARAIFRMDRLFGDRYAMPLSSPHGPGTRWLNASATLAPAPWLDLGATAQLVDRNAKVDLYGTSYTGSYPEGSRETTVVVDATAVARIGDRIEFSVRPRVTAGPQGFDVTLSGGVAFTLSASAPVRTVR